MKQAILHELTKRGAVSAMEALAPEIIQESLLLRSLRSLPRLYPS
ncbi:MULTISPECIES: hypothetical protein [Roseobacteraceae]|uniref:Uncharacterized protein n=1 Tax=Pseudosulfitobacter pseudonitzschiae TaxID=1402135 RepID=A0A221K829_9RHOB|nr:MULTISPECIES: hypothetical protein [Roseobacteraceae]ASM75161.1 hypothetical protein SULPSESMR1_04440 [Pseudosulfitobacter pseudonitzschiae]